MTPSIAVSRSSRTGNATYTSFDATGIVNGDLLLILMCWDNGTVTPTMPSGYTDFLGGTQTIGTRRAAVYGKIASSEPSAYTGLGTNAASGKSTTLIAIRNWSGTLADLVTGTFLNRATYGGTGFVNQAPAITTTHTNNLVLNLSFEATSAADTVTPTVSVGTLAHWSYTTAAGTETNLVSSSSVATSGTSVGPVNTTYQNVQASNGGAVLIAVAGIPDAPPPEPTTFPIKYRSTGGLIDAELYVKTGTGIQAPTDVVKLQPGYQSVSNMLAQATFYVAHRGGSISYPEMSLYAYTQSVVRGYGALEVSFARTSDGVWFGLHDSTLDRTSGVTGVTASALTWAQVQTYNILGSTATDNPTQPNRPYMRWEEIIAAYYGTHIIFVDPKAALSFRTELLSKMDALPNSTDHFVAKYYGVEGNSAGTTGWAHDSALRGYQGWGYFYEADLANLPTYQGRWSMLGMDYTASQSAWNTILAYGKPVIAHTCANETAVATALSKGADGFMVSGAATVTPTAISPYVPGQYSNVPTVLSTSSATTFASGGTLTLPVSSTATPTTGDVLVAFMTSSSSIITEAWSAPDGTWTRVSPDLVEGGNSGVSGENNYTRITAAFVKVLTGSPAASYDFTTSGSGRRRVGYMTVVRGADTTSPVGAWSIFDGYNNIDASDKTVPSIAVSRDSSLQLVYAWSNGDVTHVTATITPSPAITDHVGEVRATSANSSFTQADMWYREVSALSTGLVTLDFPQRSQRAGFGIVINPAS